ncbi:MAG: ABC transporter permease [Dehalococcoidia bacterium]|nr:ABC transporter permease [Dehalococcoidia bacterium]MDZ4245927.1 ABC transporter permease [Dehalococcoidia bacterium]
MKIFDSIFLALHGIIANKLRSSLTMLGIVIGVAAVIALMSIGQGAQTFITQQIQGIGTNLIMVFPGQASNQGVRSGAGSASLTMEDAAALNDPIFAPDVAMVAPSSQSQESIVVGSVNTRSPILGVTPDYQFVRNWNVSSGEFFLPSHVDARSLVAVLGSSVAETLFGGTDPVDQFISIRRIKFRVIGVLGAKGGSGRGNSDDVVMIPLTTLQTRLSRNFGSGGATRVSDINVTVLTPDKIEDAKMQISEILRERHRVAPGEEDFTVLSQEDMLATLSSVTMVMTIFLGAIAGISLLVGGIGIMNIMLVTVTERTREIGIRKSVGAKSRDIMFQFLVESAALSFTGAIIGYLLGLLASNLINGANLNGVVLRTTVTPFISFLAFGVAVAIGLFFGIYPARRAAKMDPIEALRYE